MTRRLVMVKTGVGMSTAILALAAVIVCGVAACRGGGSRVSDVGTHEGYEVYRWPGKNSIRVRDRDALGAQMKQYATLVGGIDGRAPRGFTECVWANGERERLNRVVAEASGDTARWCAAVRKCYVDDPLPISRGNPSSHCQYGHCGEGAAVGACLARDFGFGDEEIRICVSANNHAFALVRGPRIEEWCLLDRWELISHYRCGLRLSPDGSYLIVDGAPAREAAFHRLQCRSL